MKLKRTVVGTLLGALVGGGLMLGSAVAANADASAQYVNAGIQRSTAYYNASQNRYTTTDTYNDGWGSRINWLYNAGGGGGRDNTGGAGSSLWSEPVFPGGTTQTSIQSCSINSGILVGCGAWSGYVGI